MRRIARAALIALFGCAGCQARPVLEDPIAGDRVDWSPIADQVNGSRVSTQELRWIGRHRFLGFGFYRPSMEFVRGGAGDLLVLWLGVRNRHCVYVYRDANGTLWGVHAVHSCGGAFVPVKSTDEVLREFGRGPSTLNAIPLREDRTYVEPEILDLMRECDMAIPADFVELPKIVFYGD